MQSPPLYQEVFDSPYRRLVPWGYAIAAALVAFLLTGLLLDASWATDGVMRPMFFIAALLFLTGVFIKVEKMDGRVTVTADALQLEQEGKTWTYRRQDIRSATVGRAFLGGRRHARIWYLSESAVDAHGNRARCFVRPQHVAFFGPTRGVAVHLTTGEVPLLVPAADPEALRKAIQAIK